MTPTPPTPPAAAQVVIIGGGFSGASAAVQLVRHATQPLAIQVIEPRPRVGPGLAYSTTDPDHRLNGPVQTHAIDPEDPAHLAQWCQASGVLQRDPQALAADGKPFLRRSDFGDYLAAAVRDHAQGAANGCTIAHHPTLALAAEPVGERWQVRLQQGPPLTAELLIMATGHPRPRLRAPFDPALAAHPQVWANALDPARPLSVHAEARVLLVGSGLTALDMVSTLLRQGHRGGIEVLSRRGLRPRPQAPDPTTPPSPGAVPRVLDAINADLPAWLLAACADGTPPSVRGWLRALRARIGRGRGAGESWQTGFDELRNVVWRAWPLLPPAQQKRFLQRLRTWYDVHRFRTPPMTDARVRAAEAQGQVRYRAARLQSVSAAADGGLLARWVDSQGPQLLRFDAAINCTGLDAAAQVDDNPLLMQLQRSGHLQVDAAGIGFAVDSQGRAIDRHGRADPRLRLIGPPTAGTFGDPLGAMFIAAQIHRLLPDLLATVAAAPASIEHR